MDNDSKIKFSFTPSSLSDGGSPDIQTNKENFGSVTLLGSDAKHEESEFSMPTLSDPNTPEGMRERKALDTFFHGDINLEEIMDPRDLANLLSPEGANADKEGAVVRKAIETGFPPAVIREWDNGDLATPPKTHHSEWIPREKQSALLDVPLALVQRVLNGFIASSDSAAILVRGDIPQMEEVTRAAVRANGILSLSIEDEHQYLKSRINRLGYSQDQLNDLAKFKIYGNGEPQKTVVDGITYYKHPEYWHDFGEVLRGKPGRQRIRGTTTSPFVALSWLAGGDIDKQREYLRKMESGKTVTPEQAVLARKQLYAEKSFGELMGGTFDPIGTARGYLKQRRDEVYIMLRMSEKYGNAWHDFDDRRLTSEVAAAAKELGMDPERFLLYRFKAVGIGRDTKISEVTNWFGMHGLISNQWDLSPDEVMAVIRNPDEHSWDELYAAVETIQLYANGLRGRTWGNAVVEGTAEFIRYSVETALTAGAATWLKPLAAAKDASTLGKFSVQLTNMLRAESLRTLAQAPLIAAAAFDRNKGNPGQGAKEAITDVSARLVSNIVEQTGGLVPGGKFMNKFVPKAISTGLQRLAESKVGKTIGKLYGVTGTHGWVSEYGEEKIEQIFQNERNRVASWLGIEDREHLDIFGTPEEEARLLSTILFAKGIFAVTGAASLAPQKLRALRAHNGHLVLAEQLDNSVVKQQSPELTEQYLRTNANIQEWAYLDPENLDVLFQEKSDLQKRLGITPEVVALARARGGYIPVSLPRLHAYGNFDEVKQVLDVIRFDPTDKFTPKEARALDPQVEAEKRIKKAIEERDAAKVAYVKTLQHMEKLGRSPIEIKANSKILFAFADYFARESGMSVSEWLNNVAFNRVSEDARVKGKDRIAGATSFNKQWNATIELFEKTADSSTLIHEVSHYAFGMMEHLVKEGLASERMAVDYYALKAWAAEDTKTREEQKEKLARGFENFIMQGGAPRVALKGAFSSLRYLMGRVYDSAEAVGVNAPADIRSIFNGMLATDETIQNEAILRQIAEGLNAGLLDLSRAESRAFVDLIAKATDQVTAAITADKAKMLKSLKKQWRAEANELMNGEPAYNAWKAIKKEGGIDYLDLEEIVGEYMAQQLHAKGLTTAPGRKIKESDSRPAGYWNAKRGKHPMAFAEQSGFGSVEEMADALYNAMSPDAFIKDYIEGNERIFHEEYSMSDEAQSAQATIDALKALSDVLAQKVSPEGKAIRKEEARKRSDATIDKLTVSQVISDKKMLGDCKKNAKDLIEATNKGDFAAALDNATKLYENLNTLKYKADARKLIDKTKEQIRSGLRAPRGRIDDDYRSALYDLATRFGLPIPRGAESRLVKGRTTARVSTLVRRFNNANNFKSEEEDNGKKKKNAANAGLWMDVPEWLSDGKVEYTKLSFEEFKELSKLAQYLCVEGKALVSKERKQDNERIEAEIEGVLSELEKNHKQKYTNEKGLLSRAGWQYRANALIASGTKLRNMFGMAANWDENSVLMKLYDKLVLAEGENMWLMSGALREVKEALQALEKSSSSWDIRGLSDIKFPDQVRRAGGNDYTRFTPEHVVAICLNMGTEKGVQRLLDGYEWRESVDQFGKDNLQRIASLLSAEDWDNIQKIWDAIGASKLAEAVRKEFRSVYHFEMDEEQPKAFDVVTSDGQSISVKGGYYPKHYLKTYTSSNVNDQTPPEYRRASFTKRSAEIVVKPLDLSLTYLYAHIHDASRFASHTKVMRDVLRVMKDEKVTYSFQSRLGYARYAAMIRLLENMADPRAWLQEQGSALERWGRGVFSAMALYGSVSTVLEQFGSVTVGMEEIAPHYLPALDRCTRHPVAMFKEVTGKSGFMANRYSVKDIDLAGVAKKFRNSKLERGADAVKDLGFRGIKYADAMVILPAWVAAYDKYIADGKSENDAVAYADEFVAKTQGGSRLIDLSEVQLTQTGRMFNYFFSAASAGGAHAASVIDKLRKGKGSFAAVLVSVVSPIVIAGVLKSLYSYALNRDDDDDEERFDKSVNTFMRELVTRPFSSIPYVRDLTNFAAYRFIGNGHANRDVVSPGGVSAFNEIFTTFVDAVDSMGDSDWDRFSYRISKAISEAIKVPLVDVYERFAGRPKFQKVDPEEATALFEWLMGDDEEY